LTRESGRDVGVDREHHGLGGRNTSRLERRTGCGRLKEATHRLGRFPNLHDPPAIFGGAGNVDQISWLQRLTEHSSCSRVLRLGHTWEIKDHGNGHLVRSFRSCAGHVCVAAFRLCCQRLW
jgi:hypothetical protein